MQEHDAFAALLAGGLCVGLVLSYLPQVCSFPLQGEVGIDASELGG